MVGKKLSRIEGRKKTKQGRKWRGKARDYEEVDKEN